MGRQSPVYRDGMTAFNEGSVAFNDEMGVHVLSHSRVHRNDLTVHSRLRYRSPQNFGMLPLLSRPTRRTRERGIPRSSNGQVNVRKLTVGVGRVGRERQTWPNGHLQRSFFLLL